LCEGLYISSSTKVLALPGDDNTADLRRPVDQDESVVEVLKELDVHSIRGIGTVQAKVSHTRIITVEKNQSI